MTPCFWRGQRVNEGVRLHSVVAGGLLLAHLALSQAFLSTPIFTEPCEAQPSSSSPPSALAVFGENISKRAAGWTG